MSDLQRETFTRYRLSRQYRYFILPLAMLFITAASLPPYIHPAHYLFPLFSLWLWYRLLTAVYEIEVIGDRAVVLRRFARNVVIKPGEVLALKRGAFFLTITHKKGRHHVPLVMGRLKDFRATLVRLNPRIKHSAGALHVPPPEGAREVRLPLKLTLKVPTEGKKPVRLN